MGIRYAVIGSPPSASCQPFSYPAIPFAIRAALPSLHKLIQLGLAHRERTRADENLPQKIFSESETSKDKLRLLR